MGESRHDDTGIGRRHRHKSLLETAESLNEQINFIAQIQTQVKGDLIIAAASGVDSGTLCSENTDQGTLNVHVDIFKGDVIFEIPCIDSVADFQQFAADCFSSFLRNDSGMCQHFDVRSAAVDVMFVKSFVKRD